MVVFWGEPFAKAYMASEAVAPILRIARGQLQAWREAPLSIGNSERIAGSPLPASIVSYHFGRGVECNTRLAQGLLKKEASEEIRQTIHSILDYFAGRTTAELMDTEYQGLTNQGQTVCRAGGRGGHILLDYELILRLGTTGIRELISRHAAGKPQLSQFYAAMYTTCDMLDTIASRYGQLATDLADKLEDPEPENPHIAELRQMSAILERIPRHPATTWQEAVQCFWLVFVADGADSPGRFDQYMYPYWAKTAAEGPEARNNAKELLRELWRKFEAVRARNLCVSGQKANGDDATNDLTYEILDLAAENCQVAPNLIMRCHPKTPPALWRAAGRTVSTGNGIPVMYNDPVVIDALVAQGVALEDARDYAMNGCNQIDIPGKSHMGLDDGEINLLKCLELALNNGLDPLTGTQMGPKTGDAAEFTLFPQLLEAFESQVSHFVAELTRVSNCSQQVLSEHAPDPLRSLLVSDCVERGRDVRSGGALYNHGQVLLRGVGHTAHSLITLKELVFDEKCLDLNKLRAALASNWEGQETLRQRCVSTVPRSCDDTSELDDIATRVVDFANAELNKHTTFCGGRYGGDASVDVPDVTHGEHVGATPDGRFSQSPLVNPVGPVQGAVQRVLSAEALRRAHSKPDQP